MPTTWTKFSAAGAREELAADQGAQQRGAGRVADVEDVDALGAPLVGVIAVDRHRGAGRGGAHAALERQRVGQGRLGIDLEGVGHRAAAGGQGRRAHREGLRVTGSPMVRLPCPVAAGSGWAEVSVTVTAMA